MLKEPSAPLIGPAEPANRPLDERSHQYQPPSFGGDRPPSYPALTSRRSFLSILVKRIGMVFIEGDQFRKSASSRTNGMRVAELRGEKPIPVESGWQQRRQADIRPPNAAPRPASIQAVATRTEFIRCQRLPAKFNRVSPRNLRVSLPLPSG